MSDEKKWIFDLQTGEFFSGRDVDGNVTTFEVVSPWGVKGLPHGVWILANTIHKFRDNVCYAVDTHKRTDIYPFDTNRLVYSW